MRHAGKTKVELMDELVELQRRIDELQGAAIAHKQAGKALRESERKYRDLVDNALVGIYRTNLEGEILYVNQALTKMLDFDSPEEMISEGVLVRYKKHKDRQRLLGILKELGRVDNFEFDLLTREGETIKVLLSAVLHGDILSGMIMDITERKRTEEALRESEERYRNLFKNNHSVMLLIDPESAEIVDANPAACSYYGWSQEELTSKKIIDINLLTKDQVFEEMKRAKSEERQHFFFRHRLANGEIREVEVYSGPIRLHGKQLLYSIIHDITERKRAEEALIEEKDRAQRYLDTAGVIMVVLKADERVELINKKGCEILGYDEWEIVGKGWFDNFIPERLRENLRVVFKKLLAGEIESAECYENSILTRDGEERIIAWHNTLLRDEEGEIVGTLSSGEDITERKRAEEELRQYAERLRILHKIDGAILAAQSPQAIAVAALSQIRGLLPILARASVALFDLENDEIRLLAVHTNGETSIGTEGLFSLDEFGVPEELYAGRTVMVEDSLLQPHHSSVDRVLLKEGVRCYINVPLLFQGELIGTLNFGAEKPAVFSQEHVEIAQELAGQLAVAIQNARLFDSVTKQREELRALAVRLEELEDAERRRFVQELHDSVGQNLSALSINLNFVWKLLPPGTVTMVRDRLADCLTLVEETAESTRNLMAELRPSVLDDYGLMAALRWHVERFSERTELTTTLLPEQELEVSLPPTVETAIFRIAQEALTNIVKHAKARQVTIEVEDVEGGVRLVIADDGVGFDSKILRQLGGKPGWGQVIMRERATAVGGHLSVNSELGKGTQVVLEVIG